MADFERVERRGAQRRTRPVFMRFRCVESQCEFPGRCVNVSTSGAFLYVPGGSALQVGHSLWLEFRCNGKKNISPENGIKAVVMRVGDEMLESDGKLCIGLQFVREQKSLPTA